MLLDRKGRRNSIDLTNITNNLVHSSLIQNCSISSRTLPLVTLIQANTAAQKATKLVADAAEFGALAQSPSQNSVKSYIAMQKRQSLFESKTPTSSLTDANSCEQKELSNAFAQLLLSRRNTFSSMKFHQNKANNLPSQQANHLSDRCQSISKLSSANIFVQNQQGLSVRSPPTHQHNQVVPNVPISLLKAKFENNCVMEKSSFAAQYKACDSFGKIVDSAAVKSELSILGALRYELYECEDENEDTTSIASTMPLTTKYDGDSISDTVKTSVRDDNDIIDLDMTLNDSFLLKTVLDDDDDDDDDDNGRDGNDFSGDPKRSSSSSSVCDAEKEKENLSDQELENNDADDAVNVNNNNNEEVDK